LPAVRGSANKLQQVFLNLFLNARDAMPSGGMLEVRTAAHNGSVEIEVADTGAGIAREHIHRIFDPFFTTKASGRGTGLGLSVSYGIIKEHAGKIDVRSTPGKGTFLPRRVPGGQESGSCLRVPSLSSTTNQKSAKASNSLLRGEGYGVSSAETGESGLEKLEQHPYDLLLLDVSLPDRNGLDMLKEIHRRDPQLSVVLITAYGSIDMARAAFKNGAMTTSPSHGPTMNCLPRWRKPWNRAGCAMKNVQLKRALKQRFNFPNIVGKSDKMQVLSEPRHASRAFALHHSHQWRKRHRQGTHRQGHSFRFHPRGQSLCARKYRIHPRGSPGVPAFRPCEGRLHQRRCFQKGPFRSRRSGHHFLR